MALEGEALALEGEPLAALRLPLGGAGLARGDGEPAGKAKGSLVVSFVMPLLRRRCSRGELIGAAAAAAASAADWPAIARRMRALRPAAPATSAATAPRTELRFFGEEASSRATAASREAIRTASASLVGIERWSRVELAQRSRSACSRVSSGTTSSSICFSKARAPPRAGAHCLSSARRSSASRWPIEPYSSLLLRSTSGADEWPTQRGPRPSAIWSASGTPPPPHGYRSNSWTSASGWNCTRRTRFRPQPDKRASPLTICLPSDCANEGGVDGPSFSDALAGVMMPEPEADAMSKAAS